MGIPGVFRYLHPHALDLSTSRVRTRPDDATWLPLKAGYSLHRVGPGIGDAREGEDADLICKAISSRTGVEHPEVCQFEIFQRGAHRQ